MNPSHPLEHYVRDIANQVGLRDWTITLDEDPSFAADETGPLGRNSVYEFRYEAHISLHPEWRSWPPEAVRLTIVHELLHCHLEQLKHQLIDLEELLGKPTFHQLLHRYSREEEKTVELIADRWAIAFPLPPSSLFE